MSFFMGNLAPRPADALLGLMAAYREDPREEKIDLGVGIYKDENGNTPIMSAVRKAEVLLAKSGETKAYEGPRGNPVFCNAIAQFVYGVDHEMLKKGRVTSFTTPGGCGALFVGMSFAKRLNADAKVWMSDPHWPNHPHVAASLGLQPVTYSYIDAETGGVDFSAMMDDLRGASPGDVLLLQGPCHNPTGVDLHPAQWAYLAEFCTRMRLLPFIDMAYHGFGDGLDEDMAGIRHFLQHVKEAMLAYSCSKNFGLYRERTGCLLVQTANFRDTHAAGTHCADIARASYSMPPAHGAAIVATILEDKKLRAEWEAELTAMRDRMKSLRTALATALIKATGSNQIGLIGSQKGMFSQLPVPPQMTDIMRIQSGLYLPGSGRINVAGLRAEQVDRVAGIVAPFIQKS